MNKFRLSSLGRNIWRRLVNMRTAIVLLCLLAVAAIPGEIFPQRVQGLEKVNEYITSHGKWGNFLDKIQMFNVFESVWFTGIYILLFISLIGCIIPRIGKYLRQLIRGPETYLTNLSRQPKYKIVERTPVETSQFISNFSATTKNILKRWRKNIQDADNDSSSNNSSEIVFLTAKKGYLHELGNLIFHVSLLGLLVSIVWGKLFFYEGNISLVANGKDTFCATSSGLYDSFRAGKLVDGTKLTPLCLQVDKFSANYLFNGQPESYKAEVTYEKNPGSGKTNNSVLEVNKPLRTNGLRIYLMGHGYAPKIKVTFPNGQVRIQQVPFRPDDKNTLLSSGVIKLDPPAGTYHNLEDVRKHQFALEGLFAPTANTDSKLITSTYPELRNPALAVDAYVGDTGLDSGITQSIFELNPDMKEQGRLNKLARVNLFMDKEVALPQGYKVELIGVDNWVYLQISHDPTEFFTLIFAFFLVLGLIFNFMIKEKQIWIRINREQHTVEIAGMSKTSSAWDTEFEKICAKFIGV